MKIIYLTFLFLLLITQNSLSELTLNINNKINIFDSNFNHIFDNSCKISSNSGILTDLTVNNFDYFTENFNKDIISNEHNNLSGNEIKEEDDSSNFVPFDEFFYADQQRYTFTGNPALLHTKIKPLNTALVLGAYSVIFYTQHSMQQNTIWKDIGPFHFQEDIKYALWVDKFGHFFGGYATSYTLSEMFQLSGFSWDAATIWGSLLGLSYMTYVEILDGYSTGFGFSPSDFYADFAGAGFFVAQHYFPFLQNFSPKFEYVNPKWLGEYDRMPHDTFIDNYSAQTFWMSINIRNLFGGVIKEYCPKWLNLAVGYAAYSLSAYDYLTGEYMYPEKISYRVNPFTSGNRKLIIALDYDLAKMLPDGPPFWNWMKQSLNLFKLPSPAIEFGFEGKTKVYLLYPFEFRLSGFRF